MRSVLSISLPEKISSELNELAKKTGRNKSSISGMRDTRSCGNNSM